MKRLIVISIVLMVLATPVVAQEANVGLLKLLDEFPSVKQGAAWDLVDNDVYSLTTVDVITYKKKLSLGMGLLSNFSDVNYPALALNYKVGGLEQWGFEYPLAKFVNIDVGVFAGKDFEQPREDGWKLGVQASIIKVKF